MIFSISYQSNESECYRAGVKQLVLQLVIINYILDSIYHEQQNKCVLTVYIKPIDVGVLGFRVQYSVKKYITFRVLKYNTTTCHDRDMFRVVKSVLTLKEIHRLYTYYTHYYTYYTPYCTIFYVFIRRF
jgi:hypothetical protein